MADKHEQIVDPHTGTATTGHEWDGIAELNTPLPRWWLWTFYACIIWAFGYWVAYPTWPLVSGYTKGLLGYSERTNVTEALQAVRDGQAKLNEAIVKDSFADIKANSQLLNFALAGGKVAFGDNCAACHGRGAQGSPGFANLNDDNWIWGGTFDQILQTVRYGIRSDHPETRISQMPAFGVDGLLTPSQISDTAEFVRSLSNLPHDNAAAERGKAVFQGDGACVTCHGEDGKGNQEVGAPNLTANIWLYGGTKEAIVTQITTGHGGVMPAWSGRLDPATIKKLAIYVHSLGGGQ